MDDEGDHDDEHVAADRHDREVDGQVVGDPEIGDRLGVVRERQHDEAGRHQELVRHRIEERSQIRALLVPPRDQTIERIGHAGENEDQQGPAMVVGEDERDQKRDHPHPDDRQLIR